MTTTQSQSSAQSSHGTVTVAQRQYMPSHFPADGIGSRLSVFQPLVLQTADLVVGDTTTTTTLTVDGPSVISTIDTVGDQDFYRVDLVAGQSYQIGMYGYTGGPSLLSLADSAVEIYDAQGNLIASGDGGADTPANSVNSGSTC